jgi:hypothetical protein
MVCNEAGKTHSRCVKFASDLRLELDKAIPHDIQAREDREILLTIEREIK